MEERIQVHHNYISAISNHEHKKDLINRLKGSNPHNISAYEAEMTHHMIMHDDVLGRILTTLKQDDYYRTLEELPVIDGLTTYDDIQLFPEHHQRVHYPVDNGPPWDQQALTAHHLNTHHHSQLYLHNLLHHSHIT